MRLLITKSSARRRLATTRGFTVSACLTALTLALPATVAAQIRQQGSALKSPPTSDSLAAITQRGRLLWEYDYVAWHATDSVVARHPAPGSFDVYVARRDATERWTVAFGRLNAARDTLLIAYEVRQKLTDPNNFDVVSFSPARADTGYFARGARALLQARADFGTPRRPYNAAVLERPDGGLWVYVMPAQTRVGVFPLGGDVRYQVSADGRAILAKRQLHNTILEHSEPLATQGELKAGAHAAVLDDIPEDTDVFNVLVREPEVPEYIVSNAFMYVIGTNGAIRYLGRREAILGKDSLPRRSP
jgi:hypothetical protein